MLNLFERLFGTWVREVSARTLRADGMAGLLGAVLVLPQGIAFATLAGLPPEYGLYTAIVPCIIAALFGSRTICNAVPLATGLQESKDENQIREIVKVRKAWLFF